MKKDNTAAPLLYDGAGYVCDCVYIYISNANANLSCCQIASLLEVPRVDTLSVLKTRLKMLLLIMLMIKVSIKMLSAMLQWAQTAGCSYNALIKFFYI